MGVCPKRRTFGTVLRQLSEDLPKSLLDGLLFGLGQDGFPGWFKGLLDGSLGRFLFRESMEIPCPRILKKWWRNVWCLSFIENQEAQGSIYYK